MEKKYFSGLRVGDSVWTIQNGSCTVKWLNEEYFGTGNTGEFTYDMDGKSVPWHAIKSAFWSNPNVVAPEKPKRMVKKEGWMVIDKRVATFPWRSTGHVFDNKVDAIEWCGDENAIAHVTWEEQE